MEIIDTIKLILLVEIDRYHFYNKSFVRTQYRKSLSFSKDNNNTDNRNEKDLPSRIALSKSFRGSTSGMFGLTGFLSWPSTMFFTGFNFGGFVAIIFAMSPFVRGNGATVGPLTMAGGGGGGGGGGGMLHGGEIGLTGVGSGVGGGGGRS